MHSIRKQDGFSSPFPPRFMPDPSEILRKGAILLCIFLLCLPACSARRDFRKASEQDTIQAYRSFLEKHGDKEKYADPAADRMEELAFEKTCQEDTFDAYSGFLKEYPMGRYSRSAERKGEDRRAEKLGIHLYRTLPKDYYEKVNTRFLPYRILVRALSPQGLASSELEMKWYLDLERRDLFVPMNPDKTYSVNPDITLSLRQAVIYLCGHPRAYAEAETRVRGTKIKTYRVAAEQVEKVLLYEIFCDRELYDKVLGISEEEKQEVEDRFDALRQLMPNSGSVALEVDIRQDAYSWDREMSLSFSGFLNELHPYEQFATYLRGRPPDRPFHQRVYFRVDTEIHSPYVRTEWSSVGPTLKWNAWNSKWIETEKEYFFKKMTLDLVGFLAENSSYSPHGGKTLGRPIYIR